MQLLEKETTTNKQITTAKNELDKLLYAYYPTLTANDIKTLVVDDKWMAVMANNITTELDRINQRLTGRINELSNRYQLPITALNNDVKTYEAKVNKHLKAMNFVW